ncbi:hypothetical protein HYS79_03070 [Patescibacteria group bacterium]|nr:hypothetical protein [Patescibacteria group bacterium]
MQYFFWKHRQVVGVTVALFFILPISVQAVTVQQPTSDPFQPTSNTVQQPSNSFTLQNPLAHGSTLCELLNAVFSVTLTLGIPIAVVFMVIAGLKFVLALGNPKKLGNAKKNIYYTMVGIALFVGAWFLAQVVANTLLQLGGSGFNTCF